MTSINIIKGAGCFASRRVTIFGLIVRVNCPISIVIDQHLG